MRKVYLFAAALTLSASASAQLETTREYQHISLPETGPRMLAGDNDRAPGDPIYSDNFSTPANWATPADGNGNAWTIANSTPADVVTYVGAMASTTASNGHATYNGISDLLNATVTASDATLQLIAPINCAGINFVTLEFQQRYRAFNQDQTIVEVSNNGSDWTQYEINTQLATNAPAIQEIHRINISAVAGNQATVYVRFRWQELGGDPQFGSGYGWCIDDLNVFESWDYDQQITGNYFRSGIGLSYPAGLEYYLIPDEQIVPIQFSGSTQNLGAQIQTNAKLNVDVTGAGTYSGTSTPANLALAATDSVGTTTTFTPSAMGVYNVSYYVDCDQTEEVTDNDTIYDAFEVTDYEYARDNGILTSSIGNVTSNTGSPLTIGNVFNVFTDGVIGKVSIGITTTATNEGQIMYCQIMRFDIGLGEYVYVDQTPDYTVTAGDLGNYVDLFFTNAVDVFADDDILVLAGHYGGSPELRFGLAQGTDEQTVLGFTSGATAPFFLSSPSAVMMTLDMRDFASIEDETYSNFSIGQNVPNPFDANSVINYTLEEGAAVSVQFVDVTGKVVKTMNQGNQAAGTYQININGNEFAEGAYFYTFTVGENQITKRMVVTK